MEESRAEKTSLASDASTNMQTGEVSLPQNRPGRIGGEESSREVKSRPRNAPLTKSHDEMREMGLKEAKLILPNELSMMLPPSNPAHEDLVVLCGKEEMWQGFATLLVDLLWSPLAGCVPRLGGLSDDELVAKLQLFWRCAVALCVMPLAQLNMLSRRKAAFMPSVKEHLPSESASTADSRLAHIRLNLPLFAMVADAPPCEKPKQPPQPDCSQKTQTLELEASTSKDESVASTKVQVTESGPQCKESGPQRIDLNESEQAPVEGKTISSAARHIYDVGYKKWESFDVDAELRRLDKPAPPKPKEQLVDMQSFKDKSVVDGLDFDDPVKALDQAIQRAQEKENESTVVDQSQMLMAEQNKFAEQNTVLTEKVTISLAERYKRWDKFDADAISDTEIVEEEKHTRKKGQAETDETTARSEHIKDDSKGQSLVEPRENNPMNDSSQLETAKTIKSLGTADATVKFQFMQDEVIVEELQEPESVYAIADDSKSTTAATLNNEYSKWNTFDPDDEMDDISDDDDFGGGLDLDALTGPKDEVARIQRHWKREAAACRRQARRENEEKKRALRKAQLEARNSLPEGEQVHRPCMYRPADDPEATAAQAIRRDYNKWKDFDVDAAILELDNEGKTQEGDAMRCEARKGSAIVSAEGYTKDKEEFELDQDIEKQMGSLKKVIGQRLKDATAMKTEGNSLLRNGRAQDACRAYKEGLATMDLCKQASVIMADSMADKNLRLVADLHRNMAAAQLEMKDFEGAIESCDAALKLSSQRTDDLCNADARSDDDKALYRRALALLRLGRKQDARKDIEALVAIRGENDGAVKKLKAEDCTD